MKVKCYSCHQEVETSEGGFLEPHYDKTMNICAGSNSMQSSGRYDSVDQEV